MAMRVPDDIMALVAARVDSGAFSSAEEVLRSALGSWLEREDARQRALADVRAKIAEGDADENDFSPSSVRNHLDRVAASLAR